MKMWGIEMSVDELEDFIDEDYFVEAVDRNNVWKVQEFLESGIDIDASVDRPTESECFRTALHQACMKGHLSMVKLLLKWGANLHATTTLGKTALHLAAKYGRLEIAKLLFENGANIQAQDHRGKTAFHYACSGDDLDMFQFFIESGADLDTKAKNGVTPLLLVDGENAFYKTKFLLEKGANVNAKSSDDGRTQLHWACHGSHSLNSFDVAALLIEYGADVNASDKYGNTPLHIACFDGSLDHAKLLVSRGAIVDVKNESGSTPLHAASRMKRFDIVWFLVSQNPWLVLPGADNECSNSDGWIVVSNKKKNKKNNNVRTSSNTNVAAKVAIATNKTPFDEYFDAFEQFMSDQEIDMVEAIKDFPLDEVQKDKSNYTAEQMNALRFVMLTQNRCHQFKEVEALVLKDRSNVIPVPCVESLEQDVLDAWNVCKWKIGRRQMTVSKQFDILLAYTCTVLEHNTWMNHPIDGTDALVKELASMWKNLLKASDEELGWDLEYTKPGVMSLLEQFKDVVEGFEGYNRIGNFDYMYDIIDMTN